MIVLTFHEVSDTPDSILPKAISVSSAQLAGQLDHMLRFHAPIDADAIRAALATGRLPENSFCVTFDDAFIGQHDVALDILEARGIRGMFFPPTCVVHDRVLPTVERQRLLQYGNGPYEAFYARFADGIRAHFPQLAESRFVTTDANVAGALDYYAEYAFYSPLERLYRKVRETMLPNDVFEAIVAEMFAEAFREDDLVDRHFLDWDRLRRIRARGHTVGGHGHRHLLESSIDGPVAAADHHLCLGLLESHLGEPIRTYAYPYGIFVPDSVRALAEAKVEIAFTCRAGRGFDGSALLIDRYDCKAFPFAVAAAPTEISIAEAAG